MKKIKNTVPGQKQIRQKAIFYETRVNPQSEEVQIIECTEEEYFKEFSKVYKTYYYHVKDAGKNDVYAYHEELGKIELNEFFNWNNALQRWVSKRPEPEYVQQWEKHGENHKYNLSATKFLLNFCEFLKTHMKDKKAKLKAFQELSIQEKWEKVLRAPEWSQIFILYLIRFEFEKQNEKTSHVI